MSPVDGAALSLTSSCDSKSGCLLRESPASGAASSSSTRPSRSNGDRPSWPRNVSFRRRSGGSATSAAAGGGETSRAAGTAPRARAGTSGDVDGRAVSPAEPALRRWPLLPLLPCDGLDGLWSARRAGEPPRAARVGLRAYNACFFSFCFCLQCMLFLFLFGEEPQDVPPGPMVSVAFGCDTRGVQCPRVVTTLARSHLSIANKSIISATKRGDDRGRATSAALDCP